MDTGTLGTPGPSGGDAVQNSLKKPVHNLQWLIKTSAESGIKSPSQVGLHPFVALLYSTFLTECAASLDGSPGQFKTPLLCRKAV